MPRGRKKKNDIKRANGTGGIKKLSGNRRRPWMVLITAGYETNEITLIKKQIQKPLGYYETEELAKKALYDYNMNPYDIEAEKITFKKVYDDWSSRYYADLSNKSTQRSNLSAFNHSGPLHDMIFKSITITNMRDTINNAQVGISTKGRMKSLYNLLYDFAVESNIVSINVARNFTIKGLQNKILNERNSKIPFPQDHENLLWENADYGFTRMVLIGIYSGWRPQELATLKRANIDIDNQTMLGGMKTVAGTDRIVPIHSKIKEFINYYYDQSEGCEYLFNDFEGQQGTVMTYDKYRGRFRKALTRSGLSVSDYSPHCTRYTFITKAKESKMDEYAIKMIVGHEISDITESIYTHRDTVKFLKEEITKIK